MVPLGEPLLSCVKWTLGGLMRFAATGSVYELKNRANWKSVNRLLLRSPITRNKWQTSHYCRIAYHDWDLHLRLFLCFMCGLGVIAGASFSCVEQYSPMLKTCWISGRKSLYRCRIQKLLTPKKVFVLFITQVGVFFFIECWRNEKNFHCQTREMMLLQFM